MVNLSYLGRENLNWEFYWCYFEGRADSPVFCKKGGWATHSVPTCEHHFSMLCASVSASRSHPAFSFCHSFYYVLFNLLLFNILSQQHKENWNRSLFQSGIVAVMCIFMLFGERNLIKQPRSARKLMGCLGGTLKLIETRMMESLLVKFRGKQTQLGPCVWYVYVEVLWKWNLLCLFRAMDTG